MKVPEFPPDEMPLSNSDAIFPHTAVPSDEIVGVALISTGKYRYVPPMEAAPDVPRHMTLLEK